MLKGKRKVLLVNDFWEAGGAETVFRHHYDVLQNSESFEVMKYVGAHKYCQASNPFSYIYSLKHRGALKRLLFEWQPDIIHLHGFYHILSPSIFDSIRKYKKINKEVRVLFTAHDYYLIYPNSSFLEYKEAKPVIPTDLRFNKIMFSKVDSRSHVHSALKKIQWYISRKMLKIDTVLDVIISPSIFLKQKLEEVFHQKVHVLRNPFIFPEMAFKYKRANLKNDEIIKLIYFGRLSEEKGILKFLEELKDVEENYYLDIFGCGLKEKEISTTVESLKLSNKVNLKGSLAHNDLLKVLPQYNVMVIPSIWYENAPMSILEGASNGLIILGTKIGGIEELARLCGRSVLYSLNESNNMQENLVKCRLLFNEDRPQFPEDLFSLESYEKGLNFLYS